MKVIPCEIFTRCVGYFRPVDQFNPGKKAEFAERKNYKLPELKHEKTNC
jgi:anaerobic ribonucleoside-triphosphate reductase